MEQNIGAVKDRYLLDATDDPQLVAAFIESVNSINQSADRIVARIVGNDVFEREKEKNEINLASRMALTDAEYYLLSEQEAASPDLEDEDSAVVREAYVTVAALVEEPAGAIGDFGGGCVSRDGVLLSNGIKYADPEHFYITGGSVGVDVEGLLRAQYSITRRGFKKDEVQSVPNATVRDVASWLERVRTACAELEMLSDADLVRKVEAKEQE